jgi:hypothetical protein
MANQSGSVADGLKKIVAEIAQLSLLPDAIQHQEFLGKLQQAITQYTRDQGATAAQQQQPQNQPPAPQGPMNGMMGGGMQGAAINPDELRRVLQAQGATQ